MTLRSWLNFEKKDLAHNFYVYPKRKLLFLILGVFILCSSFFVLWDNITFDPTGPRSLDFLIWSKIQTFRNPLFDNFFLTLTNLGSPSFMILCFLFLVLILFRSRRRRAAAAVFLTLFGSILFVYLVKDFLNRPRPSVCLPRDCSSFPSGHAALSFYFYGMLFNLATRFLKLKKRDFLLLGGIIMLTILLISLSRIYLGYHYPTDIIGGFLLGGAFLLVVAILVDFLYQQ